MIRVASVPAAHVYVRHLSHPDGDDGVVRLDDPVPDDGRTVPGGWWPPLMLSPGWVRDNHRSFDVFHVHFGFDAIEPRTLAGVVEELHRYGKPLVYTVHDLRNPHHHDSDAHKRQQDILIEAADALITLTPGAAQSIWEQWGHKAHVLPHPHVLARDWIGRPRHHDDRFVVGMHAKSLRANMDPLPVAEALAALVRELPGAVLQLNVHDEIFEPGNHWFAPQTGRALLNYSHREGVRVLVHPYFSDDELWNYLASLTVSVLPYRFGSHSGWLEACYDLGTEVIAPACGFYRQQRPCEEFVFTEDLFDESSLCNAVRKTYRRWAAGASVRRPAWYERYAERAQLSLAHHRIYASILS